MHSCCVSPDQCCKRWATNTAGHSGAPRCYTTEGAGTGGVEVVQHAQHDVDGGNEVQRMAPRLVAPVEALHQARQHRQQPALLQIVMQQPA